MMYIDPKPLQAIIYQDEKFIRESEDTWYRFSNWDWILVGALGRTEELEEAYQKYVR